MTDNWNIDNDNAKEQWGLIFPNRREAWGDDAAYQVHGAKGDISTEEGRGNYRDAWKRQIELIGLDWDDAFELKFAKRQQALAFTEKQEVKR